MHMKKTTTTAKNKKQDKPLVWSTFDATLGEFSRNKGFKQAYDQEIERRGIARQIKQIRMKMRMTQKVVAQKAGMPQSVIARIESGEKGISFETLWRVAHAFGKKIQIA